MTDFNAQAARTQRIIEDTLRTHGRPMTRTDIARHSNLAYNTVKNQLPNTKALAKELPGGTVIYSLEDYRVDTGLTLEWTGMAASPNGTTVKLDVLELPDVVGQYEQIASRIPLALPTRITPDIDPAQAAEAIAQYAIFLASVAAKLKLVQNSPEWFTLLGGDEGYFTEPDRTEPKEEINVRVRRMRRNR